MATSKVENSAQALSSKLKFVHGPTFSFLLHLIIDIDFLALFVNVKILKNQKLFTGIINY